MQDLSWAYHMQDVYIYMDSNDYTSATFVY